MGHIRRSKSPIFFALLILLAAILIWHILFPLIGVSIGLTAAAWGFVVATVVILCSAILFFFLLHGLGVIILTIICAIWTIIAISLFPILFPILIPVLIILLFVGYMRRRDANNADNDF